MEYLILILMLLSLSLITKIIYDIIKRKNKKLSVYLSIIALILVGICVWYFIPTRYHLPDINDLNIKVSYPANNAEQLIEDINQKQQIYEYTSGLFVRRPFFNGYGNTIGDQNYALLYLYSNETAVKDDFHIELYFSLNEKGFNYRSIYCYDLQNSLILNPQDLIKYLKTLL